MIRRAPRSTLFYTTLFRSRAARGDRVAARRGRVAPRGATRAEQAVARRRPASCWWRRRSEEHTSELQSLAYLVCRLLLEKKKPLTCASFASTIFPTTFTRA